MCRWNCTTRGFYVLRLDAFNIPCGYLDFSSTRDPYRVLRVQHGAVVEVVADGKIRAEQYPNELFHARLKPHLWGQLDAQQERAARIARAYQKGLIPAYTPIEDGVLCDRADLDIGDPVRVVAGAYKKLRGEIAEITQSHYVVNVNISSRTKHRVTMAQDAVEFCGEPEGKKTLKDYWGLIRALHALPSLKSAEETTVKKESKPAVDPKPEPVVVKTMKNEATAPLTVALPESLIRKFRVLCAARDETMSAVLTKLVLDHIETNLEAELKSLVGK